jgi:hypothetical protein
MTSNRKIEANRRNSQGSTGPRSTAGKSIASRNARRHGLAALMAQPAVPSQEMEEFVANLCGRDSSPQLRECAIEIVRQEWLLRTVRAHQAEAVERLRDPYQQPLSRRDYDLVLGKACSISAWLTDWEIKQALPAILHKYRDQMSEEVKAQYEELRRTQEEQKKKTEIMSKNKSGRHKNRKKGELTSQHQSSQDQFWMDCMADDPGGLYIGLVPLWLKGLMTDDPSLGKAEIGAKIEMIARTFERRDDLEAFEVAMPDLKRLERYERRVWSALKRAYRKFIIAQL